MDFGVVRFRITDVSPKSSSESCHLWLVQVDPATSRLASLAAVLVVVPGVAKTLSPTP